MELGSGQLGPSRRLDGMHLMYSVPGRRDGCLTVFCTRMFAKYSPSLAKTDSWSCTSRNPRTPKPTRPCHGWTGSNQRAPGFILFVSSQRSESGRLSERRLRQCRETGHLTGRSTAAMAFVLPPSTFQDGRFAWLPVGFCAAPARLLRASGAPLHK